MSIFYKLGVENKDVSSIQCDGIEMSLKDVKLAIADQKKFSNITDFDLTVSDPRTKKEYQDEDGKIARGSTVVVGRVPMPRGEKRVWREDRLKLPETISKPVLEEQSSTEEGRMEQVLANSGTEYGQQHWERIRNPKNVKPLSGEAQWREKRFAAGIPSAMLIHTEDDSKSVKVDTTGKTLITRVEMEGYSQNKVENIDWLTTEEDANKGQKPERKLPADVLCVFCQELMSSAVLLPCCTSGACDECARERLIETDHVCPICKASGISPEDIVPNFYLRKKVAKLRGQEFQKAKPATTSYNIQRDDRRLEEAVLASLTDEVLSSVDNLPVEELVKSEDVAGSITEDNDDADEVTILEHGKEDPSEFLETKEDGPITAASPVDEDVDKILVEFSSPPPNTSSTSHSTSAAGSDLSGPCPPDLSSLPSAVSTDADAGGCVGGDVGGHSPGKSSSPEPEEAFQIPTLGAPIPTLGAAVNQFPMFDYNSSIQTNLGQPEVFMAKSIQHQYTSQRGTTYYYDDITQQSSTEMPRPYQNRTKNRRYLSRSRVRLPHDKQATDGITTNLQRREPQALGRHSGSRDDSSRSRNKDRYNQDRKTESTERRTKIVAVPIHNDANPHEFRSRRDDLDVSTPGRVDSEHRRVESDLDESRLKRDDLDESSLKAVNLKPTNDDSNGDSNDSSCSEKFKLEKKLDQVNDLRDILKKKRESRDEGVLKSKTVDAREDSRGRPRDNDRGGWRIDARDRSRDRVKEREKGRVSSRCDAETGRDKRSERDLKDSHRRDNSQRSRDRRHDRQEDLRDYSRKAKHRSSERTPDRSKEFELNIHDSYKATARYGSPERTPDLSPSFRTSNKSEASYCSKERTPDWSQRLSARTPERLEISKFDSDSSGRKETRLRSDERTPERVEVSKSECGNRMQNSFDRTPEPMEVSKSGSISSGKKDARQKSLERTPERLEASQPIGTRSCKRDSRRMSVERTASTERTPEKSAREKEEDLLSGKDPIGRIGENRYREQTSNKSVSIEHNPGASSLAVQKFRQKATLDHLMEDFKPKDPEHKKKELKQFIANQKAVIAKDVCARNGKLLKSRRCGSGGKKVDKEKSEEKKSSSKKLSEEREAEKDAFEEDKTTPPKYDKGSSKPSSEFEGAIKRLSSPPRPQSIASRLSNVTSFLDDLPDTSDVEPQPDIPADDGEESQAEGPISSDEVFPKAKDRSNSDEFDLTLDIGEEDRLDIEPSDEFSLMLKESKPVMSKVAEKKSNHFPVKEKREKQLAIKENKQQSIPQPEKLRKLFDDEKMNTLGKDIVGAKAKQIEPIKVTKINTVEYTYDKIKTGTTPSSSEAIEASPEKASLPTKADAPVKAVSTPSQNKKHEEEPTIAQTAKNPDESKPKKTFEKKTAKYVHINDDDIPTKWTHQLKLLSDEKVRKAEKERDDEIEREKSRAALRHKEMQERREKPRFESQNVSKSSERKRKAESDVQDLRSVISNRVSGDSSKDVRRHAETKKTLSDKSVSTRESRKDHVVDSKESRKLTQRSRSLSPGRQAQQDLDWKNERDSHGTRSPDRCHREESSEKRNPINSRESRGQTKSRKEELGHQDDSSRDSSDFDTKRELMKPVRNSRDISPNFDLVKETSDHEKRRHPGPDLERRQRVAANVPAQPRRRSRNDLSRSSRNASLRYSRNLSPGSGRNASPRRDRNTSPRIGRNASPRRGRNMSPMSVRNTSSRSGRKVSPRSDRNASPRSGRHASPRSKRNASPMSGRNESPRSGRNASRTSGKNASPSNRISSPRNGRNASLKSGKNASPRGGRKAFPRSIKNMSPISSENLQPWGIDNASHNVETNVSPRAGRDSKHKSIKQLHERDSLSYERKVRLKDNRDAAPKIRESSINEKKRKLVPTDLMEDRTLSRKIRDESPRYESSIDSANDEKRRKINSNLLDSSFKHALDLTPERADEMSTKRQHPVYHSKSPPVDDNRGQKRSGRRRRGSSKSRPQKTGRNESEVDPFETHQRKRNEIERLKEEIRREDMLTAEMERKQAKKKASKSEATCTQIKVKRSKKRKESASSSDSSSSGSSVDQEALKFIMATLKKKKKKKLKLKKLEKVAELTVGAKKKTSRKKKKLPSPPSSSSQLSSPKSGKMVTDQVSGSLEAASTEKAEQYELEEGEYLSDSD